jgi:Condensation domain
MRHAVIEWRGRGIAAARANRWLLTAASGDMYRFGCAALLGQGHDGRQGGGDRVADALIVPFAGQGAGSAGLTWGQQAIWRMFEAMGTPLWLTGISQVPDGNSVDDMADKLAYQISRHQSLRTRLIVTDDAPVRQVVSESGKLRLRIVDVDDSDDPYQAAKAIEDNWRDHDLGYDFGSDWPVRVSLVRHHGVPLYQVRALSHVVADGFGVLALRRDLAARDPVTGAPPGPVTAMQPIEEAQWQASQAGRRCSRQAEQYWDRLLRTVPADRFPEKAGGQAAGYCRIYFDSRAAHLALLAIAARAKINTSPVLFAAFAIAVARATGVNPLVPRMYVSNRFRPRLADAVSPIAQTCPCVIDVAGITFAEAVKRTYYASLGAYKHAYFEPARIRELLAAASADRGEQVDVNFVYNDIRGVAPREAPGAPPSPRDIAAALPLTTLTVQDRPELDDFCNFTFQDSDAVTYHGAPHTVNATVLVDDSYLPRSRVQACLRDMEALLVSAASDPRLPTGV